MTLVLENLNAFAAPAAAVASEEYWIITPPR